QEGLRRARMALEQAQREWQRLRLRGEHGEVGARVLARALEPGRKVAALRRALVRGFAGSEPAHQEVTEGREPLGAERLEPERARSLGKRGGRAHSATAVKVSHCLGSALSIPRLNQRTR